MIHSANGYLTEEHGNLTWIIANTPPNGVLRMNVYTACDGVTRKISAIVALIKQSWFMLVQIGCANTGRNARSHRERQGFQI